MKGNCKLSRLSHRFEVLQLVLFIIGNSYIAVPSQLFATSFTRIDRVKFVADILLKNEEERSA